MKKVSILLFAALGTLGGAQAGSFQLPTQGVRQSAMGGSGTAFPWDASSIFFNPGGLSRLNHFEISLQGYMVKPAVRYAAESPGFYTSDNIQKISTPFNLYVGGKIRPEDRLAFGLGVYTPFGSSINWEDGWRGRFVNQSIALSTIYFQPTVSYEINEMFALGVGFVYGMGNVEINKAIPLEDLSGEGNVNLKGKASGMGVNIGLQVKASDKLQFGLSYRSGVKAKVKSGKANFDVPVSLQAGFPNTDFKTELPLPDIFTLGVAGMVTPRLTLQADLSYATWSKYKSLKIDFVQNTDKLLDTDDPKNYKNTMTLRLGANYKLNEFIDIMAGTSFDPSPVPTDYLSPDAVDGTRLSIGGGLSYSPSQKFNIAASVSYLWINPRDGGYMPANFYGTYQVKSLTPSLSFTYKF